MTRSACLIFNPVAGQGDSEQDLNTIKSILEPEFELDIQFTTEDVDGGELARRAVENKVETILASGGDGTVSAVAEALINTDIPLGAIARGTANAFANALGIPDTIEAACKVIVDGATKKVDAAMCNDKPMILLAGVGFEAETVENADREAKNRFGMLAYVLSGFKQLREFEQFTTKIETKEKTMNLEASAVTIANAAPPTSVLAQGPAGIIADDGLLDITVISHQNTAQAIAMSIELLQSARSEEPVDREQIEYLRSDWVKVTTDPPQKVVLDGEVVEQTPIEVKCIPQGLTIFVTTKSEQQTNPDIDKLPRLINDIPKPKN